ncbi:host-nuclease inhibitor Gam family protein [Burkholderia sp. BDU5]|uniref:host-nuclease inhibitor Gam family protein n=1 Tax=Burkholderia sp. BDU5 TaxID=1385590 RepID=UPI0007564EE4|nr:host-nuclease inhibitor Gam family protein [Burkholderia sp. BDU5]KVE36215.1 host-nuclease inhibitor protein Gam [Burkholderia sp. BDU5]
MATKQRIKAAAQVFVAQSESDVAATIRDIGDTSREIDRLQTNMNDEIAAITERYQQQIQPLKETLLSLQSGVQTWCEAHRETLTNSGKVKTYSFITGQVQWRQRPPSCSVRGVDAVIELLKARDLSAFVRVKEEINKEAILNEPEKVRGLPGITIVTGVEDFVIEPFEQKVEVQ